MTPQGTKISADPAKPGTVYIEPPGSGVQFANTSYMGKLHLQHPMFMTYMAENIDGGWEKLLEVLDRPMVDAMQLQNIMQGFG